MKIVNKIILWFVPDSCVEVASRMWSTLPRRLFVLVFTLTLFLVWDGFDHSIGCANATINRIQNSQRHDMWLAWWSLDNLKLGGQLVTAFSLSFVLALLVERLHEAKETQAETTVSSLVHLLTNSGVDKIFAARLNVTINDQEYAEAMRTEVATTARLRILTLAGYEFFGRGKESLLYTTIKIRNSKPEAEAILLDYADPKGKLVIEQRLRDLSTRDAGFKERDMKLHVDETIDRIKEVLPGVKLHKMVVKPAFRLVLCDKCAFVSFYKCNAHGHESPVFRVRKLDDGVGWFEAFNDLFEFYRSTATSMDNS